MRLYKKTKTMKTIKLIIFILVIILGVLSLFVFLSQTPIKPFVVLSGSMRPKIKEGSIVIVSRNFKNYKQKDVITFINPNNPLENITHRIVDEEKIKNKIFYKTKGDANKNPDLWQISGEKIWGKVIFIIPFLGYVLNFSQTKLGVILIIVLPLMIVVADEVKIIFLEVKKIRSRIILLFLAMLVLSGSNKALAKFSDSIAVNAQKIEAGFWQPLISNIENTETVSNLKDIEINYSLNYYENLEYVQLCYSHNLDENFICPNDPQFRNTTGKFNFKFNEDGIWSFYTIYNGKNNQIEDLTNLEEKIYRIQIDTQAPTTNLSLSSLPEYKWSGQNTIKNGSFENGDENWNIYNGTGDHHTVSIGEGIGETIVPKNGNNMFQIGFKDFQSSNNQEDSIYQIVSIPKNLSADLSFWSRFISYDIANYDQFKVQIRRPDDGILENVLITGNTNGNEPLDSSWKNYSRSLDAYSGQNIKLWFSLTDKNSDLNIRKSWAYIDDIKITTLNTRIGETFFPELEATDVGSGILSSSTLPEIQTGENKLIYNSDDIAGNIEQLQKSNILVFSNITINQFNNNYVELFNNSNKTIDINNWQICNKNNICKTLSQNNSENNLTLIFPKNKLQFIDDFSFENSNDQIILKNESETEQDNFSFSILNNWQRSVDGIGTWISNASQLDVNIVSRLSVNKITMTIFGIDKEDNLNYEIVYTSQGLEKGIAGTIDKNTIENNKTDRDFYLGTCSSGGACVAETDIGSTLTITLTGKINGTEIEPIVKSFNLN